MKRLLIPTLLGLLAIGASAQTQPDSEVRIRGTQIQLPAQPQRMWQTNFDEYIGGYDLSNGESMTLFSRGLRMYAAIGDRPMTEVLAAKRNEFVAVDQQFKMTLASQMGDVTGEVLLRAPGSSTLANADDVEFVKLAVLQ